MSYKPWFLSVFLFVAQHAGAAEILVAQVADYSASRAALGKAMKAGAEMAFSKTNSSGSLGKDKIRFVTFDDQYKPDETVRLLEKVLNEQKPAIILGVLGTANTGAVLKAGLLERARTPLIGPYTGADSLRTPANPWVFHIRASYAEEVDRIVKHYATLGLSNIAVLHENDAFGTFIYGAFQQAVKKYGVRQSVDLVIERGSTDMGKVLDTLKTADAQGIVIGTAGGPTAAFVKSLGEANLRAFRYALSVNDISSIIATAGLANAQGFGQVQVMPDPTSGCKLKICRDFNADYQQFGDKSIPPSPTMMEGYVSAQLAVAALQRVQGEIDGRSVKEALNRVGHFEFGGFMLDFGNGQHNGSKYTDLGIVSRNGRMMY